ncbi:MAG: hypothetical protein V1921_06295 [Candidatus Altiarchaeota archaeon]
MTGTKVVKLKLEADGVPDKLPTLRPDMRESSKVDAITELFDGMRFESYKGNLQRRSEDYYQGCWHRLGDAGFNTGVSNQEFGEILRVLESDYSKRKDFRTEASLFLSALLQRSAFKDSEIGQKRLGDIIDTVIDSPERMPLQEILNKTWAGIQ